MSMKEPPARKMPATPTTPTTPATARPSTAKGELVKPTDSQSLAKLAATSALSAGTLQRYSGLGCAVDLRDLVTEMKRAGDEVVAGDLGRVERMLANQAITLDAIFNNMALRSHQQESFKGIEVLMRLALKAQAQARSTAETLALLKNPMPYIKQANVTSGPQQVNNSFGITSSGSGACAGAENFQSEPNKLLEGGHGQRLDVGAPAAASRANQAMEALGAVHRSDDT